MQTQTQKLEQLVRNANSYLNAKDAAAQKIVAGIEVDLSKVVYREATESFADAVANITAIGIRCAEPEKISA